MSVKSSKTRDRSALDDSVTDPSLEETEISDGRVRERLYSESQIRKGLVKSVTIYCSEIRKGFACHFVCYESGAMSHIIFHGSGREKENVKEIRLLTVTL